MALNIVITHIQGRTDWSGLTLLDVRNDRKEPPIHFAYFGRFS